MNHETKEVILKVTDVVKTVVHFGFIPFVIYLGAFFDSPGMKELSLEKLEATQLHNSPAKSTTHNNDWSDPCHNHHINGRRRRYGGQESLTQTVATRTHHQQAPLDPNIAAMLTFDKIFDAVVLYARKENEAPSEGNAETTAINISAETAVAIVSLDTADIEMYKQLIESVGLAGHDSIYSHHHHHNNDTTITKSSTVRSESTSASVSLQDDENVSRLFRPQDIAGPVTRPPRPPRPIPRPPPPGLPFDFGLRLNLARRRQGLGSTMTRSTAPRPGNTSLQSSKGCYRQAAICAQETSRQTDRHTCPRQCGGGGDYDMPYSESEASTAPATSTKAEPEPATATPTEVKQKTPTEPSTLVKEDAPETISPHTKQESRILDDFVIYNKNKSRSGYGFRFSDLEKCLDSYCEIGISGKVRPALIKHGRIFGRKKVQPAEAGTQGEGSTIHLSKVLGWGMEMIDNGESYLWVKTRLATYILGSPASIYGPVYDDLFKKTRLTNLLMVALIADRDVTLDNFVSNMRYTEVGACNRSPRRVLPGGACQVELGPALDTVGP
ncbi:hypothetical protein EC957_000652 [Mortierella hygrophila]|uniref:RFTS domain-containing protein n=1 Tax=Mortierella hygrophila TaxID=979708 RepID=A0A9P6FH11_9FUNG|nr:hypothetical protein EC957_000652 [Mortierella hygrophila]